MKIGRPAERRPTRHLPAWREDAIQDSAANPLVLALLFIARCLVPVGLLLGLSYLLRRLGLVQGPTPPADKPNNSQASNEGMLRGRP